MALFHQLYNGTITEVTHALKGRKFMVECCEEAGCSMPGTLCPACQRCLCWQHLQSSPCETCRSLVSKGSFEHKVGRLVGIGFCVLLCGFLILLLPHDTDGIIIQLAALFLIAGALLVWIGLLAQF